MERKISTINSLGETLMGLETQPTAKPNGFAITLVHGFGIEKRERGLFDEIAKTLSNGGYTVFRFDFSGCGESEGNYEQTSLSKQVQDLKAVLKFVNERGFENNRTGIVAQSFGTRVTIALNPKTKAIVLMGSGTSPKETISKLFGDGYNPNGISKRITSAGKTTTIGPQFWTDLDKYELRNAIKMVKSPVLFIHGGIDGIVPPSDMIPLFENANEPKKKLVLEGADHSLRPRRGEMKTAILDWFNEYTQE
ncbi:MAG: alpha/beta hydrolase [Candidatus Altiarchaeota archaeon]|nr:alpha/beta hydrolase [Candidatus Altiarchaeota archaeon]